MSEINCNNLQEYLSSFSLISSCDVIRNGALRFATPFTYPDGSYIDLFFKRKEGLFDSYILSDYGNTYHYLLDMGFNLWTAKKRRQYVIDICGSLEIKYRQNMFEVEILESELHNLSEFIVRLTQACIRITDLAFTQKLQTFATFETEIEEFIALAELAYESDPPDLIGSYGKSVKVDFKVSGHRINSLIQTWSTRQAYTAHTTSNEIYVRWLALKSFRDSYQFITVYDDSSPSAREDDYARLYESSVVFAFPAQREQFLEAIKA